MYQRSGDMFLGVLILVLMDNQNTVTNLVLLQWQKCLNPCSNG